MRRRDLGPWALLDKSTSTLTPNLHFLCPSIATPLPNTEEPTPVIHASNFYSDSGAALVVLTTKYRQNRDNLIVLDNLSGIFI